jgi:5,10-methylenetetrahydromethanopterin reductase
VSGSDHSARLPRLAIRLDGTLSPQACIALARAAESNGFSALWFAENPFARSAVPAAAACAVATRQLRIGIGVVNPFSRHPSLIAMEWGALDELTEGRAMLGIGAGIAAAVRQIGSGWDRPLSAVREAIHIVRALLRGGEVSCQGRVFMVDRVRLGYLPPRPELPIYMAAVGERSLRAAGEIADGVILSNMLTPGYSQRAASIVGAGAAAAHRPSPPIVQYVPCAVDRDRDEARRRIKPPLARALIGFWQLGEERPARRELMVEPSGIPQADFARTIARLRNGEPAEQVIGEDLVDAFAIAGTPEECLAQAALYRKARVDELALHLIGAEPVRDVKLLGVAIARRAGV